MRLAAPVQCWPVFLHVLLEQPNWEHRLNSCLEADDIEAPVRGFLQTFCEGFAKYIAGQKARGKVLPEGGAKNALQMFGDTLFFEYLPLSPVDFQLPP